MKKIQDKAAQITLETNANTTAYQEATMTVQNNAVNPKQTKPAKTVQALIRQMEPEIRKALPSMITPERFTRIALSAVSANPQLADCTPRSLLAALMTGAQLGLEPNTPLGQCYLIPYFNGRTKTLDCQFQLGYRGLIDLSYRSGEVISIGAYTVWENDLFEYELGLEPKLRHKPNLTDRGAPVYYYALFKTKSGGYGIDVMTVAEMKRFRDEYSKAAGKGFSPWDTNFDEMAKKTVLKRCLKYAPLKPEFVSAASADCTIKTTLSDDMLSEPDETEYMSGETPEQREPASAGKLQKSTQ